MTKEIIMTQKAPAPVGPYSQAVKAGHFLFCSGQIAMDPQTGEVLKADVKTQTQLVMKNIGAVLEKAGLDFQNVVKVTIFLKKMSDFVAVNEVYGSYFSTNPPARSTVEVSALPKGVDVEVEVTAVFT